MKRGQQEMQATVKKRGTTAMGQKEVTSLN